MSKQKRSLLVLLGILALLLVGGLIELKSSATTKVGQSVFTGHEKHDISLAEASILTANYRRTMPTGSIVGGYVSGDAIRSLLAQPGAVGIRSYFAKEENGTPTLVFVGVDASGNDLSDGKIVQKIFLCPPFCGAENALARN